MLDQSGRDHEEGHAKAGSSKGLAWLFYYEEGCVRISHRPSQRHHKGFLRARWKELQECGLLLWMVKRLSHQAEDPKKFTLGRPVGKLRAAILSPPRPYHYTSSGFQRNSKCIMVNDHCTPASSRNELNR